MACGMHHSMKVRGGVRRCTGRRQEVLVKEEEMCESPSFAGGGGQTKEGPEMAHARPVQFFGVFDSPPHGLILGQPLEDVDQ